MRLAFSVAAHLEPEILIVDEVLAVGDTGFQNKCLGKMQDVTRKESRTVIFVSHNMVSIEALCDRAALIDAGRIVYDGDVSTTVARYNETACRMRAVPLEHREDRKGSGVVKLTDCYFTGPNHERMSILSTGKEICVRIPYKAALGVKNIDIALNFYEHAGNVLMNLNCVDSGGELSSIPEAGEFVCTIPRFPLRQGRYFGNIYCEVNGSVADWIERAFVVDVIDGDYFGTGKLVSQGRFVTANHWNVEPYVNEVTEKEVSL